MYQYHNMMNYVFLTATIESQLQASKRQKNLNTYEAFKIAY